MNRWKHCRAKNEIRGGSRETFGNWVAPGFALLLATGLTLAGCGSGSSESASQMSSYSSTSGEGAGLFTLNSDQMAHVQIFTVAPSNLSRVLRLSGAVSYNAFRTTPVITQVGGPVSRILVAPGEQVRAGQPMLYIASPDYSALRATYLKARDAFALADKNYARAQDLYAHNAIAQRDLEQAESDRTQAQADLDASEQALKVLGISDPASIVSKTTSAEVPLLAPVDGEVVDRECSAGQLLQGGATQCFTISDMSDVWVMANVFQNDLAYVHVGDAVTIQSESYPDVFHGKISYVAPALDPTTRTLQARIETANPGEKLKNNMYVTALVDAGTIPNAIAVPDAAVLRDTENQPFVYIAAGQNQFARRVVTVGESQGGKTEILSGLAAGDRVVGDGSIFLQFQNSLQR